MSGSHGEAGTMISDEQKRLRPRIGSNPVALFQLLSAECHNSLSKNLDVSKQI